MPEEMQNSPEQAKTDGPVSRGRRIRLALENFWYHHKFGAVVTVFLLVVGIICGVQLCTKNSYDVQIMYAGPWFDCSTAKNTAAMESAFKYLMGEDDYNGDGQKLVAYRPIWLMNSTQIEELKEKYKDNPDEAPYINSNLLAQNQDLLSSELMTGESVICFLDPSIFYSLYQNGWMEDLSTFVPAELLPENPYENCGIFLKDTDFGRYFAGLSDMPEDTILCVRRTSVLTNVWSPEESDRVSDFSRELILRLLRFKTPEGA